MDDERCHELVVAEDLLLDSVEHELGEVVHLCGVDINVRRLENVLRGLGLELSSSLEVTPRASEVRATF